MTGQKIEIDRCRILVLACGNPSRGDDALGPLLIERLMLDQNLRRHRVDTLADFQLQIEHVLDLKNCDRVIFVDAAASGPEPFALTGLSPAPDRSVSTHALSPGALLSLFRTVTGLEPPAAQLLAIRGYEFELGMPLSTGASANLDRALAMLAHLLVQPVGIPSAPLDGSSLG